MPFIDPREDFGRELREQRQPTFRSVSRRPQQQMPMLTGYDDSILTPEAVQGFMSWRERQQPQPTKFMGSFPHSRYTPAEIEALGTQGATSQISPATGRLRGFAGPTNYPQPTAGADPARTQQPAGLPGLADLLKALIGAGIDPARLDLQGMFGQPQQRQPTFRDVSNRPQQPTSQQPTFSSRRPQQPALRPRMSPSVTQPTFGSVSHRPKPMSPFYEDIPRPPTGGP